MKIYKAPYIKNKNSSLMHCTFNMAIKTNQWQKHKTYIVSDSNTEIKNTTKMPTIK